MNRNILLFTIIAMSLFFGGCTIANQQQIPAQQKKDINTTLEGTVVQTATGYALQTFAPTPIGIDSYEIPVKNYFQQKIRITGQYSGDTLFVDKIEQLQ